MAREQIMTRETQELARAFGFRAAVSRPVEQSPFEKKPVERKLLALMDHSESDLGISAQKRSSLDDVPRSIKKCEKRTGSGIGMTTSRG